MGLGVGKSGFVRRAVGLPKWTVGLAGRRFARELRLAHELDRRTGFRLEKTLDRL